MDKNCPILKSHSPHWVKSPIYITVCTSLYRKNRLVLYLKNQITEYLYIEKVEEVSMNEKCHRTKSFLFVTLPFRCNSYVSQVSQKEKLSFCKT